MKKPLVFFVAASFIGVSVANAQNFFENSGPAGSAIDFTMKSVTETGGKSITLQTELNKNKVVLLDYFYTTCFNCKLSAPELEDIYGDYGPKGNNKLEIVSLDIKTSTHAQKTISKYLTEYGGTNPIFDAKSYTDFSKWFMKAPYHTDGSVKSYGLPHFIAICPDGSWASAHRDDLFPGKPAKINDKLRTFLDKTCPGVLSTATNVVTIDNDIKMVISPNPASTQLNINYVNNKTVAVNIVNVLGETVYTANMNSAIKIDISNFDKGMYFVNITDNNETTTEKVIVQ